MSDLIKVSAALQRDCAEFGERNVMGYRSGRKSTAQSFGGIERDPVAQAEAKAAECAFAIWCGLDPVTALDWTDIPDHGHDLVYGRARIDVKSVGEHDRYLLWPYTKPADYAGKSLTALVVVRCLPASWFAIERWIDKAGFERRKTVEGPALPNSDKGPHKLIPGTWFLPIVELHDMASLRAYGKLCGLSRD